jgi:hypothetical protein
MSFGFQEQNESIRQAIQLAHSADIIMFAASHNDGRNRSTSFPANSANVISIGATNSQGKDSQFSASCAGSRHYHFTTFGERVVSLGSLKSGASYATPIAAGIAALAMDYIGYLPDIEFYPAPPKAAQTDEGREKVRADRQEITRRIKTLEGMVTVLRHLSQDTGDYFYLTPWVLFDARQLGEIPSLLLNCLRGLR